jgi:hypothetical protein
MSSDLITLRYTRKSAKRMSVRALLRTKLNRNDYVVYSYRLRACLLAKASSAVEFMIGVVVVALEPYIEIL